MSQQPADHTASSPDTDFRPHLAAAFEWVAGLVEVTGTDALDDPTPCADFSVGLLLLHLDIVAEKVVGLAREGVDPFASTRQLSPREMSLENERSYAERIAGTSTADLAERIRQRGAQASREWTDERMARPTTVGWGDTFPGGVVVAIYVFELVAHGWDLAQAIGRNSEAPEETGLAALEAARIALPPEMPRGQENGVPFGPETDPPAGAGPTLRLACFLGRTPVR